MEEKTGDGQNRTRFMTPLMAWSLSLGCAVGWGAFVMPGSTFLPLAGPAGTLLGILLGAAVMLVFGCNYHFLMQRYPDSGGAYAYVKRICNYDHGFLCAWFLLLSYAAIMWANAAAFGMIAVKLFGGVLKLGFSFTFLGHDVYIGEIFIAILAVAAAAALMCRARLKAAGVIQTVLALMLILGVGTALAAALANGDEGTAGVAPFFADGKSTALQVLSIVSLAPWAFIGFETISHCVDDFKFNPNRTIWIFAASLGAAAVAYSGLALLAASRHPEGFDGWPGYIAALKSMDGLQGLPTFYAAKASIGKWGLFAIGAAALGAIGTGILGNLYILTHLSSAMAADGLLPKRYAEPGKNGVSAHFVVAMLTVSCIILCAGRTVIGWIVDVVTVSVAIVYGYVSYCALVKGRAEKRRYAQVTGVAGLIASTGFFFYFMVPNFWSVDAFSTESYLMLAAWALAGCIVFRRIFRADKAGLFGKSTVGWLVPIFLIFFASLMWVRQATYGVTEKVVADLTRHYEEDVKSAVKESSAQRVAYIEGRKDVIDNALTRYNIVQMAIVVATLAIMFNLFKAMSRRERIAARAKSYFFSTVSHDIRTPLNAIVGFSQMLKEGFKTKEEQDKAVDSILISGNILLDLINDVLDLSSLESGRMDIRPEPTDCAKVVREVAETFLATAFKPGVSINIVTEDMPLLMIDPHRLRQLAFNLISNAVKYTNKGYVEIRAMFSGANTWDTGTFTFSVEDTGCGISEADQRIITSAYVPVAGKATRHGGTGLGLAICRQLSKAMGGTMTLNSELGRGSTFTISIPNVLKCSAIATNTGAVAKATPAPMPTLAPASAPAPAPEPKPAPAPAPEPKPAPAPAPEPAPEPAVLHTVTPVPSFAGRRLLIVDDSKMNLMVLKAMLVKMGKPELVMAMDGEEAWAKLTAPDAPKFDMVLTDMWMPHLDGAGLAKRIRSDERFKKLGVYVITADVELEKNYTESGFDGIILKPVPVERLKGLCA